MIWLSDHAVDRYIERVREDFTFEEALAELKRLVYHRYPRNGRLYIDFGIWLECVPKGRRDHTATTCKINPQVHVRRAEGVNEAAA